MITILRQARPHDTYHRFLRAGAWSMAPLWQIVARAAVALGVPGDLDLDIDETLFRRSGRKVEGAGLFRDPVRTSGKGIVYARGLSVVVLTLRVAPPWGGEALGLPIQMRLHRKHGDTYLDLAKAMLLEVRAWFPDRHLRLCGDGNYASLVALDPALVTVTSRMRRDAAIYGASPQTKRPGRGRPTKKGQRLPTPQRLARLASTSWRRIEVASRGHKRVLQVHSRCIDWRHVCSERLVQIVIARDPKGRRPDEFLVSNDLAADSEAIVRSYSGRWSIEDTFRNVKQFLGGEDPQTWRKQGPERATAVSLWLYAEIWLWYLRAHGPNITWTRVPWFTGKNSPSFLDALSALRRTLWREDIFANSTHAPLFTKNIQPIIEALARAA